MILPSWLVFPQFFFSFFFFLVSFFSSFLSSLLFPSLFLLLSSCELTTVSLTSSRGICLRHSRLLLSNSCKGLRPPLVSTSECNNKMSILKKKKKKKIKFILNPVENVTFLLYNPSVNSTRFNFLHSLIIYFVHPGSNNLMKSYNKS